MAIKTPSLILAETRFWHTAVAISLYPFRALCAVQLDYGKHAQSRDHRVCKCGRTEHFAAPGLQANPFRLCIESVLHSGSEADPAVCMSSRPTRARSLY